MENQKGLQHVNLRCAIAAVSLLALLGVTRWVVGAAPAATFTVNTTADNEIDGDGLCTLREAITAANSNASYHDCAWAGSPNDTINFSVTGTIRLGSALPPLLASGFDLTIDGPGADLLTISGDTDGDGSGDVQVLTSDAPNLTLRELTIADGTTSGNGGGVKILAGSTFTTIDHCLLMGNVAVNGGAVYHGGANLTILNSEINDNQASLGGGVYLANGNNNISSSKISGNQATTGGGIYHYSNNLNLTATSVYSNAASDKGGGLYVYASNVFVTKCTFQENQAASGGGIYQEANNLTIDNSTFWGNQAENGGAILNKMSVMINSSTFYANSASVSGGGLLNQHIYPPNLRNSIIANSASGGSCSGDIANGYNNIDSGDTCGWGSANGSLSNTDPLLGPLRDNGGETLTLAPTWGSPAIDGVTYNTPNSCPSGDQRGVTRPQGAFCDIGAVEFAWQKLNLPFILKGQ